MRDIDPEFAEKLRTELGDGLGVVIDLHIRLHQNGAMSVSAPIGDLDLCMSMLENGRDAILREGKRLGRANIIVPGDDVDV